MKFSFSSPPFRLLFFTRSNILINRFTDTPNKTTKKAKERKKGNTTCKFEKKLFFASFPYTANSKGALSFCKVFYSVLFIEKR